MEYIKSQILERGFPPSVRDICEAVHLKSTSSVHSHLETLEKTDTSTEILQNPKRLRFWMIPLTLTAVRW